MTRDPAVGLGRWHERKGKAARRPSPARASAGKWAAAAALSGLLLAVAALGGWVVFQFLFSDANRPYFTAFWVGDHQQRAAAGRADSTRDRLSAPIPPLPWVDADRKAIEATRAFTRVDPGEARNPPKDVIEKRLVALRSKQPGDVVVVYLAAHAKVDARGKVRVLAYDSDPDRPDTLLPLVDVLDRLKECPARGKLLVLDVMRGVPDPWDLGGTADGVGDAVRAELLGRAADPETADPHLLVIGACSPGQVGLGSEALGGSAFAHFFGLGLTDPRADTDGNRAVSVKELARYLDAKVSQWAGHYRDAEQRPFLLGTGPDFPLASVVKPKAAGGSSSGWRWPWKTSKPATPATPGTVAEGGPQAKDQSKAAGKGEAPAPPPLPGGFVYPDWLAAGWDLREAWWKAEDYLVSPRVFRRLDAVLLRAERRWRGGDDPGPIRSEFAAERGRLETAMDRARKLPRPDAPRSVRQAGAVGRRVDPGLSVALKRLLNVPVKQIDAPRKKEFLDKLPGATSLDLAGAVVDALSERSFAPDTIEFLDALVTESQLPRDLVELRYLSQLARRAKAAPADWSDDETKQAWNVIGSAEQANSLHDARPWVGDLLDHADAYRHEAEVMSLPRAMGFAPEARTAEAWATARKSYELIQTFQDRLKRASEARGKALILLGASAPYSETADDPGYPSAWFDAAGKVRDLDGLLTRPGQPLQGDPLAVLNRALDDAEAGLNRALAVLERPFQAREIAPWVERCTSKTNQPAAGLTGKIEALLTSPALPSRARQELWAAGRALDRRLAEWPMAEPEPQSESETVSAGEAGSSLARDRLRRIAALAGLVGLEADFKPPAETKPSGGQDAWSAVSAAYQSVRLGFKEREATADPLDRTGWVAPVFSLDWQRNPTREERVRVARQGWEWLAGTYLHQAHDLNDSGFPDTVRFFEDAALAFAHCDPDAPGAGGPLPEDVLEASVTPRPVLNLSREHPDDQAVVEFLLRATDGNGARKVSLSAWKPDDPRLTVDPPQPDALELGPGAAGTATVSAHWDDDPLRPAKSVNPRGFIVQARLENRRSFHVLVATEVLADRLRPRLVLSRAPDSPEELTSDRLRLRPVGGRQPFYLFVRNPSPFAQDLVVALSGGGLPAPLEAKIKVEPNSTPLVPGFGLPPLKPEERLPALTGPLRIVLRENKPGGVVLNDRTVSVAIATAEDYLTDYLEVVRSQFIPANRGGGRNRLSVELKALKGLSNPPCKVEIDLPRDPSLFPALREAPRGTLSGLLIPGGKLTLFAEDIALDPAAPAEGSFFLDLDGDERALWFRTNFVRDGIEQRAVRDTRPRLRLEHEYDAKVIPARLTVKFLVDNAPEGSRLVARLGRVVNDQFENDITPWSDSARDQAVGFSARGESGALLFEAAVKDRVQVFDLSKIRGDRVFEARLVDRGGRKDQATPQTFALNLDDQAPQIVAVFVPGRVSHGTAQLSVKGTVVPPASRISEVVFYVGGKADEEKSRAAGLFTRAERGAPPSDREWEAQLPIPKDVVGPVLVTARFTSGVGLSAFDTREATVLPPPPPPPPPPPDPAETEKKKPPPPPGAIQGKVVEGNLTQTGLDVYLYRVDLEDKEPVKVVDSVKTGPKGVYLFKSVKAGLYKVYCVKATTNRRALKDVTVAAGETSEVPLELLLP